MRGGRLWFFARAERDLLVLYGFVLIVMAM